MTELSPNCFSRVESGSGFSWGSDPGQLWIRNPEFKEHTADHRYNQRAGIACPKCLDLIYIATYYGSKLLGQTVPLFYGPYVYIFCKYIGILFYIYTTVLLKRRRFCQWNMYKGSSLPVRVADPDPDQTLKTYRVRILSSWKTESGQLYKNPKKLTHKSCHK